MACALLAIGITPAFAQSGTATLNGRVVDQQKAALPGATVTLSNQATGLSRTTTTSVDGAYSFPGVPPGKYKLTVELSGFRTTAVDEVQLTVDTTTSTDVALVIGNLSETVQVRAEAPVLNTTDASIGNVIGSSQIQSLPLEAQNVVGLLSLQTGVTFVPKADNNTVDPRYGSVSGARADQSNVTLDGVDVNDPQNQTAFTSVLRMTPASVEEFRVTTSSYGADQGRSSGAQVSLVTKSGTNSFRGQGYYVNRNTRFSSNEYFLKLSQVQNDEPSEPPQLDKNIWGGAVGGPIKRDKLFFFGNFDGLDEARETVATRAVPSLAMRDGVLVYRCADAGACPGGTVQGLASSHSIPAGSYGLSPAELRRVDPLGIGPSAASSQYFRQYPAPNGPGRYPGAIEEYRFAAPLDNTFRTYITRLDYRIGSSQNLFGRLNFQDDAQQSSPQFDSLPSNTVTAGKNWGTAIGWDATLSSNLVNTFRFGYTRIDSTNLGLRTGSLTSFRFIDTPDGQTSTNGRLIDTNNIINDLTWLKGRHTLKTGANLRFVRNSSFTNANSFITGIANASWTAGSGGRYRPGGACPAPANCSGLPAVASNGVSAYADSLIPILGVISQTNVVYNYTIDGDVIPFGEPVRRRYGADEYEFYIQDSWRVSDTLTLTGGLRYSLFSPPWETNGQQVATNFSLGGWFDQRVANMEAGIPSNASEHITFLPGGKANGALGFYEWDKNNFAPRLAVAWTPTDRWVVRAGYGIVYDRIGAGLATTFDNGGSFGLSNDLDSPFGGFGETSAAVRFVSPTAVPATYPAAPPAGFPAEPETGAGAIAISIDDSVRTPYAHSFNVAVARELGSNFAVEGAYVGRRGRNLLVRRDMAMPTNLTDPASGLDYFGAARQLIDAYAASGGDVTRIGADRLLGEPLPGRGRRRLDGNAGDGAIVGRQRPRLHHRAVVCRSVLRPGLQQVRSVRLLRRTVRLAGGAELDRALRLRRAAADVPPPLQPGLQLRRQLHALTGQGPRLRSRARLGVRQLRIRRLLGVPRQLVRAGSQLLLLGLRRPAPVERQLHLRPAVRHRPAVRGRRELVRQRHHRRLVAGRHRPLVERLPVQRHQLPVLLGDELELAGQRRARGAGRAARDADDEERDRRLPEPVRRSGRGARSVPQPLPGRGRHPQPAPRRGLLHVRPRHQQAVPDALRPPAAVPLGRLQRHQHAALRYRRRDDVPRLRGQLRPLRRLARRLRRGGRALHAAELAVFVLIRSRV